MGKSIWSPDVEPTADSTYLSGSSFQRGGTNPFTQWNPAGGSAFSFSSIGYGLQLTSPASTAQIGGYLETLPASVGEEWSVTMKWPFEGAPNSGNSSVFGFLIGRDLIANPTTGGFLAATTNFSIYPASAGNSVFLFNQNNYASFGVTIKTYHFSTVPGGLPGPWAEYAEAAPGSMIRFSVDSTHSNYAFAISTDGEMWFEIQAPRALSADIPGASAINTIGVMAYNATTLSRRFWLPWYRVRKGAGSYRNYAPEGGMT